MKYVTEGPMIWMVCLSLVNELCMDFQVVSNEVKFKDATRIDEPIETIVLFLFIYEHWSQRCLL